MDQKDITAAAARAYKDPAFAQEILEGKQNYPEVRAAIIKDLQSGNEKLTEKELENVIGGANYFALHRHLLTDYIRMGPKLGGGLNLSKLSGIAACW